MGKSFLTMILKQWDDYLKKIGPRPICKLRLKAPMFGMLHFSPTVDIMELKK